MIEFAKFYRDRLNIEQKKKMKILIDGGAKIQSKNHFVTLSAVNELFNRMRAAGYDDVMIQNKLADELLLKGLINETEHFERTIR
jgi:hypothetical protein